MEESPSREILLQLVKKFPEYYGAQMSIGVVIRDRPAHCPRLDPDYSSLFFILDIPLCLYKSQNNCIISYNVATCFDQLHDHPQAIYAQKTKITVTIFTLGPNETPEC